MTNLEDIFNAPFFNSRIFTPFFNMNVEPKKQIEIRQAAEPDKENVYKWRNHIQTRKYCLDIEPISWTRHSNWFDGILASDRHFLLIGELEGMPLGVIRYDIDDKVAEVSVFLVPGKHGRGFGTALIESGNEWIHRHLAQVKTIYAKIMPENVVSIRAFEKSGFKRKFCTYEVRLSE